MNTPVIRESSGYRGIKLSGVDSTQLYTQMDLPTEIIPTFRNRFIDNYRLADCVGDNDIVSGGYFCPDY